MTLDAWLTLAVVAASLVLLVRDTLPPPVVLLGGTITLVVTGVLDGVAAFAGFANPAPITVAALYVLARAVEVTGALDPVLSRLLGSGERERSTRGLLARLLVPVAGASAFLNNTPIVAMTAPQVATWSEQRGRSAAPLLMPLSFAAILGGVVTSIGTSTNLVISGLLVDRGLPPLGLFEISRVGLPVAVVGVALLVLLAPVLLPERAGGVDLKEQVREFSVDMRVVDDGPLVGLSVEEAGLRQLQGVFLVRIERTGHVIAPVGPGEVLSAGDVLSFVGNVDLIVDLQRIRGLASTEEHHLYGIDETRQAFFEVVLGSSSQLAGSTLKEVGFRSRYDAAVLAVHRAGQRVEAKLGELQLRAGDTLLLLADSSFRRKWRESGDFLVVARLGGTSPGRRRKAPLVLALTGLLVVLAGSGLLDILDAALLITIALVATGVLTLREARDAVDLDVIIVIGAAFGLGAAMEATGLAAAAASVLLSVFSSFGAIGALLGVVVTTIVLTEMITNNAAAVLMFPIAFTAADAANADPRSFAIAVAVAASASFLTPIGYQTNTIVYGLGGYRFADYPRLGFPLTVLVLATTVGVVHLALA
ncbi:MAG: SLC13 family permease [Actinobacteria bacterium]|nr:SLC13 family permease [Actinomycetota bacterium]